MEPQIYPSCISLPTFTPVRRPESTVNRRQFVLDHEKDWTTARCHRLLRALTSRVAILKKDLSLTQSDSQPCKTQNQNPVEGGKTGVKHRLKNPDQDVEWTRAKKKIKRTYSSRLGRNTAGHGIPKTPESLSTLEGRKSLLPGEVSIPTPILARARGEQYVDDHRSTIANLTQHDQPVVKNVRNKRSRAQNMSSGGEPRFQLSGTLREMRQKTAPSRYTIYEGIYNGLEALLRSTMNDEPEPVTKGSRSLFSMCLKAVPDYIAEEAASTLAHIEKTGTKSAMNNQDISTQIYDDLESLGNFGRGWKHLKTVVRSHGTLVLREAIEEGLLDIEFCGLLVTLCIHTFATGEAKCLLSTLLSSYSFLVPKSSYDLAPRQLSMLWKFVECTGHVSFHYQQLTNLVSSGLLPLGWLATKDFCPVWSGVIQRLSPESVNADALIFLDTSLHLLAGAEQSKDNSEAFHLAGLKHTFSSLVTTLLSIVILSRDRTNIGSNEISTSKTDYKHIVSLLRSCLARHNLSNSSLQGGLLLVANLISESLFNDSSEARSSLTELLLDRLQHNDNESQDSSNYNDLVSFIYSVARCCGRGTSNNGFEHLERLHVALEAVSSSNARFDLLQGLIVDSAFAFAQQVPKQQHQDYASALDIKYSCRNAKPLEGATVETADNPGLGFRWEEGIGEWVTATPAVNIGKREKIMDDSMWDEIQANSPFQSTPYLPRKRTSQATNTSHLGSPSASPEETDDAIVLEDSIASEVCFNPRSDTDEVPPDHKSKASVSGDELNEDFARPDDASDSDVPPSQPEEISDTEVSFCSNTSFSLEADDYASNCQLIQQAPRFSRKKLRDSQGWKVFDEYHISAESSTSSRHSTGVERGRQHVDRAPRLGRRALQSSRTWRTFDESGESDDELSFLSASSQGDQGLREIKNAAAVNSRLVRKQAGTKQQKLIGNWGATLSGSEDELCI